MPECNPRCGAYKDRYAINAMLFEGHTQRGIARKLGISEDTINRHYARHYPHFLTKARNAQDVAKADALMRRVLILEQRAYGVLDKAEDSDNLAAALGGIREARETIKLLGQVAGELAVEGATTNILLTNPQWIEIRTTVMDVLSAFPEARVAVAGRLAELARRGGGDGSGS